MSLTELISLYFAPGSNRYQNTPRVLKAYCLLNDHLFYLVEVIVVINIQGELVGQLMFLVVNSKKGKAELVKTP